MRNLSELLNDLKVLEKEYDMISATMEECDYKDEVLTDISLAMDCIETCLMFGDYINDTGKDFDYYSM